MRSIASVCVYIMASFQGELNVEDNRVLAMTNSSMREERVSNLMPQINYSLRCQTLRGDLCGMFEMLI